MSRRKFATAALALGAALATSNPAAAGEPEKSGVGGFTMTLGGKGTLAEAAASTDDIEEAWYRRGWGGYRWGPYRNYLAFHPLRPFVNVRKAIFNPSYYGPGYYGGYGGYCCYNGGGYSGWGGGYGGYYGINGTQDDATAPAVSLNLAVAKNPMASAARIESPTAPGTFRYDGGPANPVPQSTPDANPQTTTAPASPGLPVSMKKPTKPPSAYTYKAYGEK